MSRYVIARKDSDLVGMAIPVLDLPDAEHLHLHRQPDGTYTAVPLLAQPLGIRWCRAHSGVLNDDDDECDIARLDFREPDDPEECVIVEAWVDAPTGGTADQPSFPWRACTSLRSLMRHRP